MITSSNLLLLLVFTAVTLTGEKAYARPIGTPDFQKLTADSNLVAVVDIESIRLLHSIEFSDHTRGEQLAATVKVGETIEGSTSTHVLELTYDYNPDPMTGGPWTPHIREGDHMVLFLRCSASCHITDPAYAGFPVGTGFVVVPSPSENTPTNRVLQLYASGLFLRIHAINTGTPSQALPEPFVLTSQPTNPYIATLLHEALHQIAPNQQLDLHGELLAALIRLGELSLIPEVQQTLALNLGNTQPQVAMIYALQRIDWHQTLPIMAETLRSSSADIRLASARAIQNLGVKSNVPPNDLTDPGTHILLTALHDPDPEVAFAIMQALGYLNSRHDQRPQTTSPDAKWKSCMQFWSTYPDPQ